MVARSVVATHGVGDTAVAVRFQSLCSFLSRFMESNSAMRPNRARTILLTSAECLVTEFQSHTEGLVGSVATKTGAKLES